MQVKNRYCGNRIIATNSRLVLGPDWRLDLAPDRVEDGTRPNTSYSERLSFYCRRSCSYLHRRTPGALEILRVLYNFIRPHASLSIKRPPRTPAMAAEIFDRPLSFRAILSWVPRPTGCLPLRKLAEWTPLTWKARGGSPVLNS